MSRNRIELETIEEMQHCIGFSKNRVTGTKHRVMYSYRNHYCDHIDNAMWGNLVELGLATQSICKDLNGITYFHLTKDGFSLLADLCGFEKIIEID